MRKLKKWLLRFGKKLINRLPLQIKKPIVRRLIRLQPEMPAALSVRVVTTDEEALEAFKIIDQSYKEQGFVARDQRIMTLNKYQLLPSSAILVAIYEGEVIGTLTLVKASAFGLPCQRVFKLPGDLTGPNIAEVTCLAIKKEFRRERGVDALFPLMRYMYFFSMKHWGVNKICATCLPRDFDFYNVFFGFEKIPGCETVADYLGAPADAIHLDLDKVSHHLERGFRHLPKRINLFDYMYRSSMEGFLFPEQPIEGAVFWNSDVFKSFLTKYSGLFHPLEFDPKEEEIFKSYYPGFESLAEPSGHSA